LQPTTGRSTLTRLHDVKRLEKRAVRSQRSRPRDADMALAAPGSTQRVGRLQLAIGTVTPQRIEAEAAGHLCD